MPTVGGPGWDDVVLPGFDEPEVVTPRPTSKAEQAKARRVHYRRHRSNATKCDHCLAAVAAKESVTVRVASNTRVDKGKTLYLCFLHTVEARHADQLAGRDVSG